MGGWHKNISTTRLWLFILIGLLVLVALGFCIYFLKKYRSKRIAKRTETKRAFEELKLRKLRRSGRSTRSPPEDFQRLSGLLEVARRDVQIRRGTTSLPSDNKISIIAPLHALPKNTQCIKNHKRMKNANSSNCNNGRNKGLRSASCNNFQRTSQQQNILSKKQRRPNSQSSCSFHRSSVASTTPNCLSKSSTCRYIKTDDVQNLRKVKRNKSHTTSGVCPRSMDDYINLCERDMVKTRVINMKGNPFEGYKMRFI